MAFKNPKQEALFKDLDISFSHHPVTGALKVLKNEEAVKRSVKNLVLTNLYEKKFQPFLAGDVISQLFEQFDTVSVSLMKTRIENVLNNYEPRVKFLDAIVNPDYDRNAIRVTVVFELLNKIDPVTVDLFLQRIR